VKWKPATSSLAGRILAQFPEIPEADAQKISDDLAELGEAGD
jgi:monomeric isocitrate dehydrogenase